MVKCPKCGEVYNDNTWFCIKCGTMIDQEADKIDDGAEAAPQDEVAAEETAEVAEAPETTEAPAEEAVEAEEAPAAPAEEAEEAAEPVEAEAPEEDAEAPTEEPAEPEENPDEEPAEEPAQNEEATKESVEEPVVAEEPAVEEEKPAEEPVEAEEAPEEPAEEAAPAEEPAAEEVPEAPAEEAAESEPEAPAEEEGGMQFTDYRDTAANFDNTDLNGAAKADQPAPAADAAPEANVVSDDTQDAGVSASAEQASADEVPAIPVGVGGSTAQDEGAYRSEPSYEEPEENPNDTGSIGWAILGFLFPIVGLILFLVWRDSKPKSSKSAGMGALISVIVNVVLTVIFMIIAGIGMGLMATEDAIVTEEIATEIMSFIR